MNLIERLRATEYDDLDACKAADMIEVLEAQLAECKRDAARYRWLRDMDEDPVLSLAAQYTDCNGSAESISKRIDAAIDAAMGETK